MRHSKFNKKVRFSSFLPYGITSQYALELSMETPRIAGIIYNAEIPMQQRVDECNRLHLIALSAIRDMEKYGYINSCQRKYGNQNWEEIRVYSLTRSGLYLLTNTPSFDVEQERIETSAISYKRNMKNISYLPNDENSVNNRMMLYKLAAQRNVEDNQGLFDEVFLAALKEYDLSILAWEPQKAEAVVIPPVMKGYQLYKAWRLANVNALFRSNDYLTMLDRRPFTEIVRRIDPTHKRPIQQNNTVESFVQSTIDTWYNNHSDSYSYKKPELNYDELNTYMQTQPSLKRFDNWYDIPSFYATSELPGYDLFNPQKKDMNERGSNTVIRHSCIGIAVGYRTNYLVYHTRPKRTPWSKSLELNSAILAQKTLDKYGNKIDFLGANRSINNAIIVCPTIHQFANLFTECTHKNSERSNKGTSYTTPFNSVCIVPVNHSGSIQLQALMLTSPEHFDKMLINTLKTKEGFSVVPTAQTLEESCFQLSYNKVPVLLAHSMNMQHLTWALKAYNAGRKFYVMCYPEQVKYISHVMPNVEFL